MAEVELVLSDEARRKFLSLWLLPTKTSLAERWLSCLKQSLKHPIKKHFSFFGFLNGPREPKVFLKELNYHIKVINAFNKRKIWKKPYYIEEILDGGKITQEQLNKLHHHFELLVGQVWNRSHYILEADIETGHSIQQINHLVHEYEAYLLNERLYAKNPNSMNPWMLVSFEQNQQFIKPLLDQDYELFTYDHPFGCAHLAYCQTGKTHMEAWNDKDLEILDKNINGLRYYSGEFVLKLGNYYAEPKRNDVVQALYRWLESKGTVIEKGAYFIDKNGIRQGLGFPVVANLAPDQFAGKSYSQIYYLLSQYQDIYKIRVHDENNVVESAYSYKLSDRHYHTRMQACRLGFL